MYLEHFGLREAPFRITPHTEFFFAGANRGATLDALIYAITHDEGIVKISGEVGSGKTMLCRVLIERLPPHVVTIYLANPSLSRDDILFALASELQLKIPPKARTAYIIRMLQDHLIELYGEGKQVVVLIDEAHAMPADTLEEIRLLSNLESNRHKLLQLALFGQPELNDILSRSDMRQLKERITHNFVLEPLIRADISDYIDFRLRAAGYKGPTVFSPAAVNLIARASLGLTRRINILSDKSMLAAFAANSHEITPNEVKAAIKDCDFSPAVGRWKSKWPVFIGAAALGAVTVAAISLTREHAPSNQPTPILPIPTVTSPAANPLTASAPTTVAPIATGPANKTSPVIAAALATHTLAPAATVVVQPAPAPTVAHTTTPLQSSAPASTAAAPTAALNAGENKKNESKTEEIEPVKLGQATQTRYKASIRWLASTPDEHWFIQLLATDAGSADQVEHFVNKLLPLIPAENLHIYVANAGGYRRIGVIYGDFVSKEAAIKSINDLPSILQSAHPYPRQVKRLR